MISRRTRTQLLAFVVLACVGIVYVGGKYAGLGRLVGPTTYSVTLHLADSGGLFTNAEVTYSGVTVGRVGDLHPTTDGVDVELRIKRSAEKIPADGLTATVRNLSVIGEPYVDLVPTSTSKPYLGGGAEIAVEHTSTPVAPADLLASLNDLLRSVPQDSLVTVLDELDKAFSGTGPALGHLLDNTAALVRSAQEALPATTRLIHDSAVVLGTQNAEADNIRSFGNSLRDLAHQLKSSDGDLRRLVATGPSLATQLVDLLDESGPGLSQLVADLLTSGRLTGPRTAALRQLLITYPALARGAYSAIPGDGTVHFGLVLNVFDPLPCTKGYEATKRRPGSDVRDTPINPDVECAERRGSPIDVRGSQNAPHQGVPDAVVPPSRSTRTAPARTATGGPTGPSTVTVTPRMLAQLSQLLRTPDDVVSDPLEVIVRSLGGAS